MEEVVDTNELGGSGEFDNSSLKVLSIFSYIGKGTLLLFSFITLYLLYTQEDLFKDQIRDADISTSDFIQMGKILFGLFAVTSIACIMGLVKYMGGSRTGFIIYAASNGIFILIFILSMDILMILGLVSLGFTVFFGRQLKNAS